MINTITFAGVEYQRKGRRYDFAVVTQSGDHRPLIEWASTRELAEKNFSAIESRIARAKRGETLKGCYSTEYFREVNSFEMIEVRHS